MSYSFLSLDPSGASTTGGSAGEAVNNLGTVVGYYATSYGATAGFIESDGSYSQVFEPSQGADGATQLYGINVSGTVVGDYFVNGNSAVPFGFVAVPHAGGGYIFTDFSDPNAIDGTSVQATNDTGGLAGFYLTSPTTTVGFVATPVAGGGYSFIDIPGPAGATNVDIAAVNIEGAIVGTYQDSHGCPAGATNVEIDAVNNEGAIVGTYQDSHGDTLSFLATPMNDTYAYTTIIDPIEPADTIATGINDSGLVVGYAGTGAASGFLFDSNAGTFVSIAIGDPATSQATEINGIDDDGTITGGYISNTGAEVAFVGTVSCFTKGSHLATPSGPRRVETLRPGDLVHTASGGTRPILWIGQRRIDCRPHPDPDAVQPIAIARHAFAACVPSRELRLSPDHSVLIDRVLVPIRLLVNNVTIHHVAVAVVTYFHVELATHDILLAEDLPVESYLHDGSRGSFAAGATISRLCPSFETPAPAAYQALGACAALAVDPARVLPIWERLARRARLAVMSHDAMTASAAVADGMVDVDVDVDLHLLVGGRTIRPLDACANRAMFAIGAHSGKVLLCSRAARPSAIQPWLDDRRLLGVAVTSVRVYAAEVWSDIPLDAPHFGPGWWPIERSGQRAWRWGSGRAWLDVPVACALIDLRLSGGFAHLAAVSKQGAATAVTGLRGAMA